MLYAAKKSNALKRWDWPNKSQPPVKTEEYPKIFFHELWYRAPIILVTRPRKSSKLTSNHSAILKSTSPGNNFWTLRIINMPGVLTSSKIWITQEWKGASPSFNLMPKSTINLLNSNTRLNNSPKKNTAELTLWIKKYFTLTAESSLIETNHPKNPKRFSSILTHKTKALEALAPRINLTKIVKLIVLLNILNIQ